MDREPRPLRASDLRAGAAMVVAALMADGTSEIEEIGHIERGYENIVEKAARRALRSARWIGCCTGIGNVIIQNLSVCLQKFS